MLVFDAVEQNVHDACCLIGELDENIVAILMMEGNEVDVVKIGTFDIADVDGHSILLAQINDALIGEHKMAQLLQNSCFLFNLGVLQLFPLKANCFVDAELASEIKIIVLNLDFFILAPAAVNGSIGALALVQG